MSSCSVLFSFLAAVCNDTAPCAHQGYTLPGYQAILNTLPGAREPGDRTLPRGRSPQKEAPLQPRAEPEA